MLEEKTDELKQKMVQYADLVKEMVRDAVESVIDNNLDLAKKVIEEYEPKVNDMEIIMDEECINFIARFQPEAKPLRSVMMLARMVSDLERIGDKAVNIAESALSLYYKPLVNPSIDIRRMTEETLKMMSDSILSLVHEDAKLAYDVLKRDDIVDGLRDQILRELIASMVADPSTVESSLHLLRVARNLEKIADITTNICEEAVYIKEGRVVKHHHV